MPHSSAETQIINATHKTAAAALAGGIIAASGRPWAVKEALSLDTDITFAMHPAPGDGHYQAWEVNRDQRLNTIHSKNRHSP
jgi:hypothetical protein